MVITIGPISEKACQARIAGRHLATRLGAGDDPLDHADDPPDHIVVPNAREIGELVRFADHHPRHRRQLAAAHHRGGARQEHGRKLGERTVKGLGRAFDLSFI
jgi:hypothetical protein